MKKTALIFILLFLVAGISGARVKQPETALEMNNYLVGVIHDLYEKGTTWGTKYREVSETHIYSELTEKRIEMERIIVARQVELGSMKDVAGSEDFRKAILNFLKFEGSLVQEAFVPFESLNNDSKKSEIKKLNRNLTKTAAKEGPYLDKVRKIQAEYAKKNNLQIVEPDK